MKEIKELYVEMYQQMINKDEDGLNRILDDSFVLTHMTGMKQPKSEYINAIMDGTLNYYSVDHENIQVEVDGVNAYLKGDSYVEAKVFGGAVNHWRLRQFMSLINKDNKWYFLSSEASTY